MADLPGRRLDETLAARALGPVDILVNLVGGLRLPRLYTPFLDMTGKQWRATMDLMGGFHLFRAFAPGMLKRGWGRIVNVARIGHGGGAGRTFAAGPDAAPGSPHPALGCQDRQHRALSDDRHDHPRQPARGHGHGRRGCDADGAGLHRGHVRHRLSRRRPQRPRRPGRRGRAWVGAAEHGGDHDHRGPELRRHPRGAGHHHLGHHPAAGARPRAEPRRPRLHHDPRSPQAGPISLRPPIPPERSAPCPTPASRTC
ncbi:SDR family NAD(P)-dependent oxidoreductase [Paracoccus sp. MC1854]|nr:SDR family NAD(P)-dependent oxidoreductase [Paracoccus sp. MC1854]